jgi:hypothetical protein
MKAYYLWPYAKAKFVPVAIEVEVNYAWGSIALEDGSKDTKIEDLSVYFAANC